MSYVGKPILHTPREMESIVLDQRDYSYLIKGRLADVNARARKYGLSYGKFVATVQSRTMEAWCRESGIHAPAGRERGEAIASVVKDEVLAIQQQKEDDQLKSIAQLMEEGRWDDEIARALGISIRQVFGARSKLGQTEDEIAAAREDMALRMIDMGYSNSRISRDLDARPQWVTQVREGAGKDNVD